MDYIHPTLAWILIGLAWGSLIFVMLLGNYRLNQRLKMNNPAPTTINNFSHGPGIPTKEQERMTRETYDKMNPKPESPKLFDQDKD